MKALLLSMFCLFLIFIGAYVHEKDIIANCKEQGYAEYSIWTEDVLDCSVRSFQPIEDTPHE